MRRRRDTERGTALLSALLIVALMSVLAVELVDNARFTLNRASNVAARDQAYWHARGARDYAEMVLLRSVSADREVMRPTDPWVAGGTQVFDIEGGALAGTITDGNNCFNINTLAPETSALETDTSALTRQDAAAQFEALTDALGLAPGDAADLRSQIIDWIDADTRPEPGGAEDGDYARLDPPYRAANQPFTELEELLALPVVTPALYQRLEPWLCVRPERVRLPVNVNTLSIDQAPLLAAALEGAISLADAETVLFRRPVNGYDDLADFWSDPVLARLQPDAGLRESVALSTRWFEIDVEVRLGPSRFTLETLSQLGASGRLSRRTQRFGAVG